MLCPALSLPGVGDLLSFIALIILSIEDIKKGEIHYRYLILIVDFLYPEGYLLLVFFIFIYKKINIYIGGADLLIFCLLITRYGIYNASLIFFYAAAFALGYCLIKKKSKIKFIPFILLGFIILILGGKWK